MFRGGQQIGPYTLINPLGKGGFGEVWLASRYAKFVTTKVAVKLPLKEQVNHDAVRQEATIWAQASGHPNVLPIIEADEYDGQVVIVSEYAPDGSLELWLTRNGKMSIQNAVKTTVHVLAGLEFLHSRKIIHRDLKPANILLQGDVPRLADFGISRALKTTSSNQSQNISGTFAYMAPEAWDGRRSVQTDIWAVGVNLYQFLTGTLPFPQSELSHLFSAIKTGDYEPLPDRVPPEIKRTVDKALSKRPTERYQTAQEMRECLTNNMHRDLHSAIMSSEIDQNTPHSQTGNWSPRDDSELTKRRISSQRRQAETVVNEQILIPYCQDNKWGFCDREKRILISPQYDAVGFFENGLAEVRLNEKWGFIDEEGTEVVPMNYESIEPFDVFAEGLAIVKQDGKYGVIDRNGHEIVQPKYQSITNFGQQGWAQVRLNDHYGLIDTSGREFVPETGNCYLEEDGSATVYGGGASAKLLRSDFEITASAYGTGKKVIAQGEYDDYYGWFVGGLCAVKKNDKWGFIDATGKEVVDLKYDHVEPFSEGVAVVMLKGWLGYFNNKYGFVNSKGREVVEPKYDLAESFREGVAAVRVNRWLGLNWGQLFYWNKYHLIDRRGQEVAKLNHHYSLVSSFVDGLAKVGGIFGIGLIDKTGRQVVRPIYNRIDDFSEGLAIVEVERWPGKRLRCGVIDRAGKEIVPPKKYREISDFVNGLARAIYGWNSKNCMIDKSGRVVIDFGKASYIYSNWQEDLTLIRSLNWQSKTGWLVIPYFRPHKLGPQHRYCLMNEEDKKVIVLECEDVQIVSERIAMFEVHGMYALVDKTGKEISLPYDQVGMFESGYASASFDGKCGVIDELGDEVIPFKYDQVKKVSHEGVAIVSLNGQWFCVDKSGTKYYS